MDSEDNGGLSVGFSITTGSSEEELLRLSSTMQSVEGQLVQQAAAIERATGKMLNLGGSATDFETSAAAITAEMRALNRETAAAGKAGDSMVRQLDRQIATFGTTRIAAAALRMENAGLSVQADELRAKEAHLAAMHAQAASAKLTEAEAAGRLAREHASLAAMVQGSQAAMVADAAAAERLRASTDPLYAATTRLNAEIAESTRLYYAGATAPVEYARQQGILTGRLREVETQHSVVNRGLGAVGGTGRLAGHHMQNLAFQFQDLGVQMAAAAGSSAPLKLGLTALLQQGAQIQGIMSQAGIGIRGVGVAFVTMSKTILLAAATNPYLLAIGATIGLFAGAVSLLNKTANESDAVENYAKSLGLTKDQIEELGGATVTWGDTAKAVFQVAGETIWSGIGPAVMSVWETMKEWGAWIGVYIKLYANFMLGVWVGAYNVITKTWRLLPAVLGDLFYSSVNLSIDAINILIQAAVYGVNGFIATANKILSLADMEMPSLSAGSIANLKNQYKGAMREVSNIVSTEMNNAQGANYMSSIGDAFTDHQIQNAKDRIYSGAEDKGFLDNKGSGAAKDKTAATDKHAEAMQRESDAAEPSIKNLYLLADAYKASGAQALVAEARLKAESDAIKDRVNIEARVIQQIRLSIAQRVSDSAKSTAAVREQATAQDLANQMVVKGQIGADKASEWAKDQIADLPLLAALQVAQQSNLQDAASRATAALADQRAERERLRAAEENTEYNKEISGGEQQLAMLREEYRLISASNYERIVGLAILKATQEAQKFSNPENQKDYIKQQVDIAKFTYETAAAVRSLNDELNFTANTWDLIAGNVQNAASGIADAFGKAGAALGGLATVYANFQADRARADADHKAELKDLHGDQEAIARAEQRFAIKTANVEIGAFGDMAAAAKGFFNEKSAGYKALATAEKVFRAIEFALSVRAMAQDIIETGSSIANSAVRVAKYAVEAVAKAIASLPFPANLIAGAATVAALASIGVSIAGSFGGGGAKDRIKPNTGTGTTFGDPKAESESIKNAISALKDVDVLMLNTSRQMAASLRTIEDNIAGFARLLVRQGGDINASEGVVEGFKASGIGKLFGSIPVIGGLIKSLFGTKTTVVGSGLFGGPQALGNILSSGFSASYYSDIEKKKRLLGVTTSRRYSTQFTNADAGLENQFTLIFRNFNAAILAAAGPLGAATSEIEARLNGFVVDIGKIDLKGLTGKEIEERLNGVFGAAADNMARAAFPFIDQFQRVGEGAFETLTRVVSTIESVSASLSLLGQNTANLDIAARLGLADQFENVGALSSAVDEYFQTFYTDAEQSAARMAQLTGVFTSLDLAMPSTLAAFRQMVEAQDLTSVSGRETYAMLLQLAPAFADLQAAMNGAKSAADIATERTDLQRQLLELQGDTAAIRALQLAKLDASNRAIQLQIWAIQDANDAAKAADELRKAWMSVGDSLMTEVKRIRGLTDVGGGSGFALLQGQFNAATTLARSGDEEATRQLPQLSQALLTAAAEAATSRQELDRVQAQTAASLEATFGVINALVTGSGSVSNAALLDALTVNQSGTAVAANDSGADTLSLRFAELRDELAALRAENTASLAAIASNTGSVKRTLDNVTGQSGGDAISTVVAA